MGIHDYLFPVNWSPGSQGGPSFDTDFIESDGGAGEARVTRWQSNLSGLRFDLSKQVQNESDVADMLTFHTVMRGGGVGFRFRDETDFSTNPNHVTLPSLNDPAHRSQLALVDSSAEIYQLQKAYVGPGGRTTLRKITRPIKPGDPAYFMAIFANGTLIHAAGVTQFTPEVTVHYDTGLVYIPGLIGATIEAAFTFDVPAHFSEPTDRHLGLTWQAGGVYSSPVTVDEIVGDFGAAHEEHLYGGGADIPVTENPQVLRATDGLYQRFVGFQPGGAQILWVPDDSSGPEPIAAGGPWFLIENQTGKQIQLRTPGGQTLMGVINNTQYGEVWKIAEGNAFESWVMR